MELNIKKLFKYFTMLLFGFSILFYGIVEMVIKDKSSVEPTNTEIMKKAEELGMVRINDIFLKEDE